MSYINESAKRFIGYVPTETGVYPSADGTKWASIVMHGKPEQGVFSFGTHAAREEAEGNLRWHADFQERFWAEKVALRDNGDRTEDSSIRNVIRVDGEHFVASYEGTRPHDRGAKGFGGRVFRWRWLDDPEGVVHFSDCVWFQGVIPEQFRESLPDNAVMLSAEAAMIANKGVQS